VPLIVRAPGLVPEGKRIAAAVGLIDVLPTVLELLDVPRPRLVQGRSLVPLLHDRELPPVTLFADLPKRILAARKPPFKWILNLATGEAMAFDLAADPRELTDIRIRFPPAMPAEILEEFRAVCSLALPAAEGAPDGDRLDPVVREKLRALGYLE
jgi:arylsulfatase A-like enzyme